MILKASQRGGTAQLGRHLLSPENEHVEVHEVSGFIATDVMGAMKETRATAMGTRCTQPVFSLNLSAPPQEEVHDDVYLTAINKVAERTGLSDQPRMIVFHEKEGRRHCHCVWSRIDADKMKAVELPFFKEKLQAVSREMYLENGWDMPDGLRDRSKSNPKNFTLEEWQQAKRIDKNAKDLKTQMQDAWASSDSLQSFEKALEDRGLYLAKGDRRGHVALTHHGEVLSIAKYAGLKAKDVRQRLGSPNGLNSVDDTKARIAEQMTPVVQRHIETVQQKSARKMHPLNHDREKMTKTHKQERDNLKTKQNDRWDRETQARSERFRTGFKGLWDRLTGTQAKLKKQNEMEIFMAHERDKKQAHDLRMAQLKERRALQQKIQHERQQSLKREKQLHQDLAAYRRMQEVGNERKKGSQSIETREFNSSVQNPQPQERLAKLRHPQRTTQAAKGPEREV